MTNATRTDYDEVVIGCEGTAHALKIIDSRYVRWQCRRSRCLNKAELKFGRRMRVYHVFDTITGTTTEDYKEAYNPLGGGDGDASLP